ncbi:MAG: hypothetical protein M9934_05655 [Thermomicrobiales bacterium]|nr:hypothetical protein [Thermomicrobiales bacterium]
MQLSRRSITKALLLAPAMLPNRTFARQNDSIQPLDTGDVIIKSISPDGSTLMGLADRDVIAFLNAETLEEVSRTEPVAEIKLLDELSIAWSPDSGKIAFSLDAWIRGRDSDIFVVETATGTITNLTGEGTEEEAPLLFGEESHGLLIDVYPYWMSNDTILFGRHQMTDEMITCVLTTLRLSSNEVDNWASLHDKGLPFVAGPLHRVGENSMAMWMTDDSSQPTVVVARATGEFERINSADVPFPRLVHADEAFAIPDICTWQRRCLADTNGWRRESAATGGAGSGAVRRGHHVSRSADRSQDRLCWWRISRGTERRCCSLMVRNLVRSLRWMSSRPARPAIGSRGGC